MMTTSSGGNVRLQWSHVFSDMVSPYDFPGMGKVTNASMEPCLFRHGKEKEAQIKEIDTPSFNGAMSFQTW